ncbi:MAG: AbrB/MazE/SpoVT family DNA-binding domain-containing protein [Acidobacteriia bacterium]|nr:AbrB/MazE/SpoVT family DNA-binding domain-containing protein [Terriglobia bacterium]
MASAQIVKWGNSLAVRIPKPLAEEAGLTEGDKVTLGATDGQIELRRAERIPTLQELVAQITTQNRYEEVSSGRERGKETVEW